MLLRPRFLLSSETGGACQDSVPDMYNFYSTSLGLVRRSPGLSTTSIHGSLPQSDHNLGRSMESYLSVRSLNPKYQPRSRKSRNSRSINETIRLEQNIPMDERGFCHSHFTHFTHGSCFPRRCRCRTWVSQMMGATSRLCGQKIRYWSLRPSRLDDHPRQAWDGGRCCATPREGRGGTARCCGRIAAAKMEREVESCIMEFGPSFISFFELRADKAGGTIAVANRGIDRYGD